MSGVQEVPAPTATPTKDSPPSPHSPETPQAPATAVPGVDYSLRDESERPCTVKFVNATSKNVEVIWLDFLGREDNFQNLSPDSTVSIRTYRKHPWIFRDSASKERLYVKKLGGRSHFFEAGDFLKALSQSGKYSDKYYDNLSADGVKIICVLIDKPVDTLRNLSLQTIRRSLRSRDDCFCLNAPSPIQFELYRLSV